MLKFLDGHLMGTTSSAGVDPNAGGGGGGQQQPANSNFLSALPEPLRANPAFKDVKDVSDLATRYADANKPFAERLPEKIRGEAYFKDIKTFDDLATKAYNQAKMIGKDPNSLLVMPVDEKDADGWKAVWSKLGTPEAVDKYQLPALKADGKPYSPEDQAFQKSILPILHKANLTQGQLAAILPEWDGLMDTMTKSSGEAQAAEMKASEAALRGEWGAAYDQNHKQAETAIAHLSTQLKLPEGELSKELTRDGLGNRPGLAKIFAYIGATLKEDGLIGKDTGGHGQMLSPAEAQQQIAALQANPAWSKGDHPEHKSVMEQIGRLYSQAYPSS